VEPNPLVLSGHNNPLNGLSFFADGRHVATGSFNTYSDRTVRIWDVSARNGNDFGLNAHDRRVWEIDFSPDGSKLATASVDGTAAVWDSATGQALLTLAGHSDRVMDISYDPGGGRLATASTDGTAIVWDAISGEALLTLDGHGEGIVGNTFAGVLGLAFNPDGSLLATAGADQTARLWDAETGQELRRFSGHTGGLTNVVFSPDGKILATASDRPDATVKIWETETGRELFSLPASHNARVWGLEFSPDGRMLATAGQDTTVKIWQLDQASNSGRLLATLTGHSSTVLQVVFSSDGRILATGGRAEVKLWDLSEVISATLQSELTERVVPELLSLPGGSGIALSPDTRILITGFIDGSFRSYMLDLDELVTLAHERLTRSWTADECNKYRIEPCPAAEQ
jgi:WD40 repeat protein